MKNILIIILFYAQLSFTQEFKPFIGKLVYSVEFSDSISKKPLQTFFMTIFTNDTIVRLESESNQLGKQVTIRHMNLNKYYILMEFNNLKYAIQHQAKTDTSSSKYTFKSKFGHKRFAGKKAKKIQVNSAGFREPISMYYFENFSPKYLEALKGIPGLPVEYYIQTEDGIYHYKLIEFKEENVSRDLFGIPSDYKKVSFDEFMKSMMQTN